MNHFSTTFERIDEKYRITFISALLIGLFCHAMMLFNKFCLHDDVTHTFKYGTSIASGRWGLELLAQLEVLIYGGNGHFSLPVLNGSFSIFLIGLSACLIVYLLGIESRAACIFTGGIMVAFPTVTATFFYMFTAHYYFLAYFLTVSGVCLICRGSKLWMKAAAVLMIAFAIGVYQAYIPTVVVLMILYLMCMLHNGRKVGDILKKIVEMLICSILFMAVYFLVNKIFLAVTNTQLVDHKGINTMESTSLMGYLKRLPKAVRYFFKPAYSGTASVYPLHILTMYYIALICLMTGVLLTAIRFFMQKAVYGIIYVLLCMIFPVGVMMIFIMAPEVPHQLMEYSQALPFIALIMMVDKKTFSYHGPVKLRKMFEAIGFIYFSLLLIMYAQLSNTSYLKAEFVQEEAKSYFTTMVTRIRSTEGYKDDMRVVFLNLKDFDDASLAKSSPWFDGYYISGDFDLHKTITGYSYQYFLERWCGFSPRWTSPKKFLEDPEHIAQVQDMSCYPDDGSIKIIDKRVVVNFGTVSDKGS